MAHVPVFVFGRTEDSAIIDLKEKIATVQSRLDTLGHEKDDLIKERDKLKKIADQQQVMLKECGEDRRESALARLRVLEDHVGKGTLAELFPEDVKGD